MNLPLADIADWLMDMDVWDAVLTVLIFADVVLLVVAIFRQPGTVQMSPLREAAIATGHEDRKTLFESSLRPFLWVLLAASHSLALPRLKDSVRRTLVASGNPSYYTPEEYIALAMFTGVLLAGLLEMLNFLAFGQFSLVAILAGLLLGFLGGLYQLYSRASGRLRAISKRVPYALDLLALAMGAGATFTEAVRTVARGSAEDPFNIELNTLLAEIDLGATRRKALENLADRVPLDSLRSIVASAIQAEELGTPLSEVLHAQANLMRLQRSVKAENAAAVAGVRILVPSLLILIGVVCTLFAPTIIRWIQKGGIF